MGVERSVGMVDMMPFPLGVRLKNAPTKTAVEDDAAAKDTKVESSEEDTEEKVWSKRVQLFKMKSHVGKRRLIKFQHDKDILFRSQWYIEIAKSRGNFGRIGHAKRSK